MAYPLLYAISLVPVMVASLVVITFVERSIGFDDYEAGFGLADLTTWRYNGDVVAAVMILIFGGFVFLVFARVLTRIERLREPTVRDHFRHCLALYAILGILLTWLIVEYENLAAHGISLGYGLVAYCFLATGYAIFIDALTLFMKQRRSSHQHSRSIA